MKLAAVHPKAKIYYRLQKHQSRLHSPCLANGVSGCTSVGQNNIAGFYHSKGHSFATLTPILPLRLPFLCSALSGGGGGLDGRPPPIPPRPRRSLRNFYTWVKQKKNTDRRGKKTTFFPVTHPLIERQGYSTRQARSVSFLDGQKPGTTQKTGCNASVFNSVFCFCSLRHLPVMTIDAKRHGSYLILGYGLLLPTRPPNDGGLEQAQRRGLGLRLDSLDSKADARTALSAAVLCPAAQPRRVLCFVFLLPPLCFFLFFLYNPHISLVVGFNACLQGHSSPLIASKGATLAQSTPYPWIFSLDTPNM